MPTKDIDDVLRVGCSVAFGVTDLTAAFPHGGTSMGVIGGPPLVRVIRRVFPELGGDDKYAGQPMGMKFSGESWVVGLMLRQWDQDLMSRLFYQYKTVTGTKVLTDFTQAGTPLPPGSDVPSLGNLIVSPTNPGHPAVLFYDVRPVFEETMEMLYSGIHELAVGVVLQAFTTSVGMYQKGPLAKLSLT